MGNNGDRGTCLSSGSAGREALKTESSECFLLFGPWGRDVDILGTSENQRLKCSVSGRAVVDGCLRQLKVINREARAGASMQVRGITWVNNRNPLCACQFQNTVEVGERWPCLMSI